MKIQYKFVNETISIDVPDDWGEILIDLDRQEYNNDHKETRRHYSLEGKVYEGMGLRCGGLRPGSPLCRPHR